MHGDDGFARGKFLAELAVKVLPGSMANCQCALLGAEERFWTPSVGLGQGMREWDDSVDKASLHRRSISNLNLKLGPFSWTSTSQSCTKAAPVDQLRGDAAPNHRPESSRRKRSPEWSEARTPRGRTYRVSQRQSSIFGRTCSNAPSCSFKAVDEASLSRSECSEQLPRCSFNEIS